LRRFTRLTNAFSKKLENHACAVALHSTFYNFVRIHQTLKITPAMAAGVTDRLWEISDIVTVLENWEAANSQRQPAFEIRVNAIGGGNNVRVTFPSAETETVYGFTTLADAKNWIGGDSQVWLYERRQREDEERLPNSK
jgi:hypothetical protein